MRRFAVLVLVLAACGNPPDPEGMPAALDDGPAAPSLASDAVTTDADGAEPTGDLVDQLAAAQTVSYGVVPGPDFGREANRLAYHPWLTRLRTKRVRLWFGIVGWTPSSASPDWYDDRVTLAKERIASYAAHGIAVTLTISGGDCRTQTCPALPSSRSVADAYFTKLAADLGTALDHVDAIEVWNEWDHVFGPFSANDYVDRILAASSVLRTGHPKLAIVAGSVATGKEADVGELVVAGASTYADGFAYHPYVQSAPEMRARLASVRGHVPAGKTLHLTEWGCRTPDADARASCVADSLKGFGIAGVNEADYFVVLSTNEETQSTFGLLEATSNGDLVSIDRGRNPLYDAYRRAIP